MKSNEFKVIDVFRCNLEEQMVEMSKIMKQYKYIGYDTEFGGFLIQSSFHNEAPDSEKYALMYKNVNSIKLLQVGFCFGSESKEIYHKIWQFNLKFSLNSDLKLDQSIDLLKNSGIDFDKLDKDGIDPIDFASFLYTSGLVMNKDVFLVTFQCGYDIAYLLKAVTNEPIPSIYSDFRNKVDFYLPSFYDIRYILQYTDQRVGSLQDLANDLCIGRVGTTHQAGSDCLLTLQCFYELEKFISRDEILSKKNMGL